MASSSAAPGTDSPALDTAEGSRQAARILTGLWWLQLVTGIVWLTAALVILQFDQASITTVGVIVGVMFVLAGLQQFALGALADSLRWLWMLFGVLFVAAGIICFINPEATFAGLADILGFLFLTVGAWWVIRAVVERAVNPLWWLGLLSGVLMVILAFWTSGQFFIDRAYTLLVFAGIWALMQGITDIGRAFMLRALRDAI
jgi:uncharacterized membrane protein HdeD (DUF308 family)